MASSVTVAIPTYNGAAFLEESIASVLAQDYDDLNLIVSDDCSTDQTCAIVESFADRRLRLYRNTKRLGLVGNWNRCIELAGTPYLCIFHQDDVMYPNNIAAKVAVLEQEPQLAFVFSQVEQIDRDGKQIDDQWHDVNCIRKDDNTLEGRSCFDDLLMGMNNFICCPSVVLRTSSLHHVGLFDPKLPLTADWEMWMRLSLMYDVGYISSSLLQYRWHENNEAKRFSDTVHEVQQYYLAKRLILDKFPQEFENEPQLRRQIATLCGKRAYKRSINLLRQRKWSNAINNVWLLARIAPHYLFRRKTLVGLGKTFAVTVYG